MKKFQVVFEGEYTDDIPLMQQGGEEFRDITSIRVAIEHPDPKQSKFISAVFTTKEFENQEAMDAAIEKFVEDNS